MFIYKITNIVNGKIYVGQTKNSIRKRFLAHLNTAKNNKNNCMLLSRAIKKHGVDNFIIEQIDNATNIDNLNEKEIFWIAKLNSTNKNIGYNIRCGGDKSPMAEETKRKISSTLMGHPVSESTRKKLSDKMLGRKYSSYTRNGSIGRVVSEETKKKISKSLMGHSVKRESVESAREKNSKPVLKYSLDGFFIEKYPSSSDAARKHNLRPSAISRCCRQKMLQSGNFIWRWNSSENIPIKIESFQELLEKSRLGRKILVSKPVLQYDLNNNFIEEHESALSAAKKYNTSQGTLSNCCRGINKTHKGFIWRYK